jgi:uncharacterized protein (DUF934 family)
MAVIKNRQLVPDSWQLLDAGRDWSRPPLPSAGDVIVPASTWRELREPLVEHNGRVGVWLSGSDDPAVIAGDFERLQLIAVRFAAFTDGRGYSIGRLLRERFGWQGELRAIGDVHRDQLYYLRRCGFDSFALREGEDVGAALRAFDDFSEAYQAAVDMPLPLYRRRAGACA